MAVLSIQSQVVYGYVGNAAALLPLQRQGFEVWPVPTATLSFHPGHGAPAVLPVTGGQIAALVEALSAKGLLGRCRALIAGWLGSAANGAAALDALGLVRAASPRALFLCDPVLGDRGSGLYVPQEVAAFLRDRALPAADIATPNMFELEWLTGRAIATLADALAAAAALRARGPKIVCCTSLKRRDGGVGGMTSLETLVATAEGAWVAATPELSGSLHGAGDIFAALLLARLLKGKPPKKAMAFAVAGTYGVLSASVVKGADEPLLVEAQEELVRPTLDPKVQRVG